MHPSRRQGKKFGALTSNNPIVHGMVSIGVEVSTYVSYYLHTIVTKSAGQRIQGRDLDKPKDSTWVFSFHPEATRQAHTQGIQKYGRDEVHCQHVAHVTKVC